MQITLLKDNSFFLSKKKKKTLHDFLIILLKPFNLAVICLGKEKPAEK